MHIIANGSVPQLELAVVMALQPLPHRPPAEVVVLEMPPLAKPPVDFVVVLEELPTLGCPPEVLGQ
jgi:hypothetical protein